MSNLVSNDIPGRPIKDIHYLPSPNHPYVGIVSAAILNVDVVAAASSLNEGQPRNRTPGCSRISPILSVDARNGSIEHVINDSICPTVPGKSVFDTGTFTDPKQHIIDFHIGSPFRIDLSRKCCQIEIIVRALLSRSGSFFLGRREGGAWSVEGKTETDKDKRKREKRK